MAVKTYSYAKDKNTKLSSNFTVGEFACIDGGLVTDVVKVDTKLVEYLQNIRTHFGKPVNITSSYRPEPYNASIGGAYGSYHTLGKACDFYISGVSIDEIAKYAEGIGILGVGCYHDDLFVHIDTRTTKFYWYNQCCTETNTFGGQKVKAKREKMKVIQNWLNKHFKSGLKVDSEYKAPTLIAVRKAYQYMCGIKQDGKLTYDLLNKIPALKKGMKSAYVALLQAVLIGRGYEITFDGTFGVNTEKAVKTFQGKSGLKQTGIVGITEMERLLK